MLMNWLRISGRRRSKKLSLWGSLSVLFIIYALLSFKLHNLAISRDNAATIVVETPRFGAFKAPIQPSNHELLQQLPTPKPIPVEPNTSIVEGNVKYYLESGKDLWEHSQILPNWMKGEWTKTWMEPCLSSTKK